MLGPRISPLQTVPQGQKGQHAYSLASLLTSLALAGRIQVIMRAQQLALAIGSTIIHTRGQESAQPHFSSCVVTPHKPVHTMAVTWSSGLPHPTPLCTTHRGPTPHKERRVKNQVPVCGNGIRSLATLEVVLTERRKPARDSEEGREKEEGGGHERQGGAVSLGSGPRNFLPTYTHCPETLSFLHTISH